MKLVLLGYMGCGESAISNAVSKATGLRRIDLDDYIEEKEEMKISEIFETKGEIYFRKKETEYLKELLITNEDFILSLGGGTPCFSGNMDLVNQSSVSVYLSANVPTLVSRLVKEKAKRPLIARISDEDLPEFIGKHLFERAAFYSNASVSVSVNDRSVAEITQDILQKLES